MVKTHNLFMFKFAFQINTMDQDISTYFTPLNRLIFSTPVTERLTEFIWLLLCMFTFQLLSTKDLVS